MARIDGEAPADIPPYVFGGWVMDATPEQRAECSATRWRCSRKFTASTPTNADLSFLDRPEHGDTAAAPAARLPALVLRVGART